MLTAVMVWAVISTAVILNHEFLCYLLFLGFNKCLNKYETKKQQYPDVESTNFMGISNTVMDMA